MTKEIGDIPEWFHGSRLNFAENLLRYDGAKVALIQCGACMCGWVWVGGVWVRAYIWCIYEGDED